jgi:hypothetical protein
VSADVLDKGAETKKEEALKSVKKIFEERFKTGKNVSLPPPRVSHSVRPASPATPPSLGCDPSASSASTGSSPSPPLLMEMWLLSLSLLPPTAASYGKPLPWPPIHCEVAFSQARILTGFLWCMQRWFFTKLRF